MASREFCNYVLDTLSDIDGISSRSLFGGHGLYKGGVMFALIADDVLFYKVGPQNQTDFEDAGSEPFNYSGKNKPIQMSYWRVPEEVFEDSDAIGEWTLKASEVALKAKKRPKRKKPIKKKS